MISSILKSVLNPYPFRALGKRFIKKFSLGTFEQRARIDALNEKSAYGYCVYHAALLGKRLGHERVSVIEFGVAGGNGLVALENHAKEIEKILGIGIDVYGFDMGEGLPKPIDYRDCPHYWQAGFYKMDVGKLKARLSKAKLVLGDVKKTVPAFLAEKKHAPLAAAMFDLDYYSSTVDALKIFDGDERSRLPRVLTYFDDVMGSEAVPLNDYLGQPLAIAEYNSTHPGKKISFMPHLFAQSPVEGWYHKIRMFHDFKHRDYTTFIGPDGQQNHLS